MVSLTELTCGSSLFVHSSRDSGPLSSGILFCCWHRGLTTPSRLTLLASRLGLEAAPDDGLALAVERCAFMPDGVVYPAGLVQSTGGITLLDAGVLVQIMGEETASQQSTHRVFCVTGCLWFEVIPIWRGVHCHPHVSHYSKMPPRRVPSVSGAVLIPCDDSISTRARKYMQ